MAQTLYCTREELENFLSEEGVLLFSDDDSDGTAEAAKITQAIVHASAKIDFYCLKRYDASQLALSAWINGHCVTLAACRLMHRRACAPSQSLAEACQEARDELKMVLDGEAVVPGALLRKSRAPGMSNYRVVDGYQNSDIRVTERNSVTPSTERPRDEDRQGGWE